MSKEPRMSVVITINERETSVLQTVFKSVRDQIRSNDEMIVVLDRTPPLLADFIHNYWYGNQRVQIVARDGPPGWRSPVKAWNVGFDKATGDFIYAFSSETTQAEMNLGVAKGALTKDPRTLIFGKAECSCGPYGQEVNWNGTAPGNLLCSAEHPRPLGFIWAGPMAAVREIGGYDENFYEGYWFDDNDFYARLWNHGLDFAFDDSIHGTHIHHERPGLATVEGQLGITRNQTYIMRKWGCADPLGNIAKKVEFGSTRTTWRHA